MLYDQYLPGLKTEAHCVFLKWKIEFHNKKKNKKKMPKKTVSAAQHK